MELPWLFPIVHESCKYYNKLKTFVVLVFSDVHEAAWVVNLISNLCSVRDIFISCFP